MLSVINERPEILITVASSRNIMFIFLKVQPSEIPKHVIEILCSFLFQFRNYYTFLMIGLGGLQVAASTVSLALRVGSGNVLPGGAE